MGRLVTAGPASSKLVEPVAFEFNGQPYWLLTDEQRDEFVHVPGDLIAARCPACGSPIVLVDGDLVHDARGDGGAPMTLGAYWALCDACVHTWHRSASPDQVVALCQAKPATPINSNCGLGVAVTTNKPGGRA